MNLHNTVLNLLGHTDKDRIDQEGHIFKVTPSAREAAQELVLAYLQGQSPVDIEKKTESFNKEMTDPNKDLFNPQQNLQAVFSRVRSEENKVLLEEAEKMNVTQRFLTKLNGSAHSRHFSYLNEKPHTGMGRD